MAPTQQVIYNLLIIGAILSFGIVFCTYSRILALDVLDENNSQFKVELHVPAVAMEEAKTEEVAAVAEAVSANEAAEDEEAAHTNQDRHELSPKFGEYATDKSLELTLTPLQERAREIFLQNATVTPPPNRLGAFVHVGKAGGSTLSALLKFGCHSFALQKCDGRYLPNETAVSKLVTYYHTPDFMNKKLYHSHYEFYLFSLRDPMARAISVYCYEHPYNTYVEQNPEAYAKLLTNFNSSEAVFAYKREQWKNMHTRFPKQRKINNYLKLYDCFPDLETYANLLDNVDNFTSGEWEGFAEKGDCENVAKLTMHHGAPSAIQHQHWDLSLIINGGDRDYLANKTVLVVRTEHQNDDWVGANQYLGQEGTISEPTHKLRDSSAIDFPIKKDLSEEGRKKLCMALNGEYKIYLKVLAEAVNLSLGDKYDSLQHSRTNCPWLNLTLPDGIDEVKT